MIWLTTFNDLITLLMVFFVLLFSMSSLDIQRFLDMKFALQSALGVLDPGTSTSVSIVENQDGLPQIEEIHDQKENGANIASHLKELNRKMGIDANFSEQKIFISLEDHLLFEIGKADITQNGYEALDGLLQFLSLSGNTIRVEGHTDNIPIVSARYPSNWELSTARSVSVVRYFIGKGISANRLSAIGYADLKPIVPNDSSKNRALNRRVEIVVELGE